MFLEGFTLENKEDRDTGKDSQGEVVNPPVFKGFNTLGNIPAYRGGSNRTDRLAAGKGCFSARNLFQTLEP